MGIPVIKIFRSLLLGILAYLSCQVWGYASMTVLIYTYDAGAYFHIDRNLNSDNQNYFYDGTANQYKPIGNLQGHSVDTKYQTTSFFAFYDGLFAAKGASNIATAPKLAAGLRLQYARSSFKANGTLTDDAIANSRKIIDASEIGDRAIPRGFSKFSTQTFQSPSGDFQTRFLRNENTGEVLFNNPNFKTIFNRTSGQK